MLAPFCTRVEEKHDSRTSIAGAWRVTTALVSATSISAQAATIQVFQGDSIQDAVNSAHRGDTIVVHQGTSAVA
jgi:hypothetical protein